MIRTSTTLNNHPSFDTKYWWIQILLGIGFIVLSIWFYMTPVETYVSLAIFFSYAMFVTGVFEVINALSLRKTFNGWGLLLTGAIIDLLLGGYLITNEIMTLEILPLLLGIWFIFRSFSFLVTYGLFRKKSIKNTGWLLVGALLILVFAIAILAMPVLGELTLVYTVSFAFFFMGLFRITLGIQLLKARKQ
ncbi:DUF308 domain-containing protein [Maribacter sp. ANRC-HE7]|uniref:DUF308 domain-containing protein n=1 Tax=Maribacter aquimaris TaxID=2737171 RepID=A0ABR7UXE8_9FLAO|nr:DUF308 domain-containing protein [Maribacter aquimaris]MBD0776831.1 DUF308 domain-containing protein [Maribacter aquimaris]